MPFLFDNLQRPEVHRFFPCGITEALVRQGDDSERDQGDGDDGFRIHKIILLEDFSALNQSHQNHDHGDDQENVNEAPHGRARDEPENPEDDQDDSDEIEHERGSLASGLLDVISGLFDIATGTTDGIAAGGKKRQSGGSDEKWQ